MQVYEEAGLLSPWSVVLCPPWERALGLPGSRSSRLHGAVILLMQIYVCMSGARIS